MSTGGKIYAAWNDLSKWKAPDLDIISATPDWARYCSLKLAIELYAQKVSLTEIQEKTGVDRSKLYAAIARCQTMRADGTIQGFRALLRYSRVRKNVRSKPFEDNLFKRSYGGYACAFELLLDRVTSLRQLVKQLTMGPFGSEPDAAIPPSRRPWVEIHRIFLDECTANGVLQTDYPFTTELRGQNTLIAYCNALILADDVEDLDWIRARHGKEVARYIAMSSGYVSIIPCLRFFGEMQLDFHKLDSSGMVILETPDGGWIEVLVARIWLGVLHERVSNAVCGIYVSLEANTTQDCVLEVLESALTAAPADKILQKSFSVTHDGFVLPNQIIPLLEHQCFDLLKVDNAWAHAASSVIDSLVNIIGCAACFGPTRTWWTRHKIEHWNQLFTQHGHQLLPNTHGAGPTDTRVETPGKRTIHYKITLADIQKITEATARWTLEFGGAATHGVKPIELLTNATKRRNLPFLPLKLPNARKGDTRLLWHRQVCIVHGRFRARGAGKVEAPYIKLLESRWTSPLLSRRWDLIGKELLVCVYRRDLRIAQVSVVDTMDDLGHLAPPAKWRRHRLTWRIGKLITRHGRRNRDRNRPELPVENFLADHAKVVRDSRPRNKASASGMALARVYARGGGLAPFDAEPREAAPDTRSAPETKPQAAAKPTPEPKRPDRPSFKDRKNRQS